MLCCERLIKSEADALEVPGQQLSDAIDGMIGDAIDDVSQISLGIEAVGLGSFDEAVDCCCTQSTCIRTSKGPVASAEVRGDNQDGLGVNLDG